VKIHRYRGLQRAREPHQPLVKVCALAAADRWRQIAARMRVDQMQANGCGFVDDQIILRENRDQAIWIEPEMIGQLVSPSAQIDKKKLILGSDFFQQDMRNEADEAGIVIELYHRQSPRGILAWFRVRRDEGYSIAMCALAPLDLSSGLTRRWVGLFRRTCGDLLVRFFILRSRLRVQRASGFPAPSIVSRDNVLASLGRNLRRGNADACQLFAVIARSESDEAIQPPRSWHRPWIASRSLSSDAHSRDPLARNDGWKANRLSET
jgi:hypothetical protein